MIVVDASALLAIIFGEADSDLFEDRISEARIATISAVNWFEVLLRVSRFDGLIPRAERIRLILGVDIAAISPAMVDIALSAHLRFGKGRHPAGLNLGDCFAYALARERNAPLLFKGADFALTDIASAAP